MANSITTIMGTDGTDTLKGYGNSFVKALGGRDLIIIAAEDGIISNPNLVARDNETIDAGAGNYTITNNQRYSGNKISINGGDGNDLILNGSANYGHGNNSTLEGGDGNDSIQNYGDNTIIDGDNGNDSIVTNGEYSVIVIGGTGDDIIENTNSNADVLYKYAAGDGNDTIIGLNDLSTLEIDGGTGTYSTQQSGFDIIVTVGEGSITLQGAVNLSAVNIEGGEPVNPLNIVGTEGADNIRNSLDGATIQALGGADSVWNYGDSVSVDAGTGNDSIDNWGSDSTIEGGAGNDSIYSRSDNTTIDGGDGNDTIKTDGEYSVIVIGGTGDEIIENDNENADVLYKYSEGDGNDTIIGLNDLSTLQIGDGTGTYSTQVSGSDIVVTVGDGSITLKDAASLATAGTLNITGEEVATVDPLDIVGTEGADNISNSLDAARPFKPSAATTPLATTARTS